VNSREIVAAVYEAFARRDVAGVLARFHPDVEFRLAEGHPYSPDGAAWTGHDEVTRRFFARAAGEWEGLAITPGRWHAAGDTVVLECRYGGVYRTTGRRLDAQACHVWTVRDGRVRRFQQYIDTARLRAVMDAGPASAGVAAAAQAELPPSTMSVVPVT
jgi:hypothetical protein